LLLCKYKNNGTVVGKLSYSEKFRYPSLRVSF
jgi:hypothetical protein